ncbi:stage II sporulation protein M [Mucilaginibacter rubeus]|uniref:Stage II sporulation protein M n=1 Tax=Mucilaginibacter rubeus TaxID=2027860 RepID=A0AAE6MLF2_9SPHI|nr:MULTISPECIES: stage II sporulation protein M [Mucilaginibacter]QEM07474.1 stage II sporulation protein M [Mucilaginibacter rubeus]QEM19927.1 stage II sporulation protein M [Mucilaginibacter gossypii]QTE43365.1 stage II sporulation protein M [Mucilaginibacter rubeus]QTE49965.1 stage II sporulation protein M [Mucilaginibacter rubeus]QTE55056.1 stage II sporulation protein M [Mucilaginibacter rubeus]
MREPLFIKQNSAKWKSYETEPAKDPDELAERFIIVTDDLAYSKTFYPKSKTTLYLNGLAAGFHQSIYKNKKEKANRFVFFWKTELPLLFKQYQRQILYSFIFFITFFLIGIISAKYDRTFIRFVLSDDYVNMTNENISKGDPFGVFKSQNEFVMFWMIAKNNLTVTAITFVLGITLSAGTVINLFRNGLMVGCFQYLFISKGLGIQSVLVIWIHGTLEISTIILAGAAGLIIGNSLLFPKTFSRMVSLKKGALNGLKIMLGISPIVVTAAVFESFITRHTEMPVWLSSLILGGSFLFIIWYVVVYPAYLSHRLKIVEIANEGEY